MLNGSLKEVMQNRHDAIDCSINGKCSNCGSCCNDIIPLSNAEINRIKHYVSKNNIKPILHFPNVLTTKNVDTLCPFRDEINKKCTIYEIRPKICKLYFCHTYYKDFKENVKIIGGIKPISMRKAIYGKYI